MKLFLHGLAFLLISSMCISQAQQQDSLSHKQQLKQTLELGKPIEKTMSASEVHHYQIKLNAGEFLRAVVDQRGIDIVVNIYSPDNKKIFEGDSPNGTKGPEPIDLEAKTSGYYLLEVRPLELPKQVKPGRYEAKIKEILTAKQYTQFLEAKRDTIVAVKQWLTNNAIPLKTVEAGNGFDDMQPLKKIIGDARIVSLGEATHGTREFFQLKHRMLEFLVNEMGFTIFGIEATMPEAFDINEYVLTGKGNPEKALSGLYFWTWDTEEVLEMIYWMRNYNADQNHKKKVKFYGFDMQYPTRAVRVTIDYLHKVDPELATVSEKSLAILLNPFIRPDFRNLQKEKKEKVIAIVNTILNSFDKQKKEYIEQTSTFDWELAYQNAKILAQYVKLQIQPGRYSTIRDSSMAENINWILGQEGTNSKIVVWAHNGHVSTLGKGNYFIPMGYNLRRMYGRDLVVFGFSFNQGSFQARGIPPFPSENGVTPITVGFAPQGSLDATFANAGLSIAAINFQLLSKDSKVNGWFNSPHLTRYIGAAYNNSNPSNHLSSEVVTSEYDAMFFIEKTTSARPNEGGKRPSLQKLASPTNLNFETGKPGKPPLDWVVPPGLNNFDFNIAITEDNPHNGNFCATINRSSGKHYGEKYGDLHQRLDATKYRGKKIKLSAYIRTDVREPGNEAYMWLRIMKKGFAPRAVAFYENMSQNPITNREWQKYEIVGEVPKDAYVISYGLAFVGNGSAWLDDVSIEVIER